MPVTDPFGRDPIAVEQPPFGGRRYPFVDPSEDIHNLLGDAYLSYEDATCEFTFPFSIGWLYGFGDQVVSPPPGWPTPAHAHDLVILDALGQTVFDSTQATAYVERPWGDRLLVIEWTAERAVCRVTLHTAWRADAEVQLYDLYITPANGTLDPRTYEAMPQRVRSIRVGNQVLQGNLRLEPGYNMVISSSNLQDQDGGRLQNAIAMNAVPGAGNGRFPGCTDVVPLLRTINQIKPNAAGNFTLQLDQCYRAQLPIDLSGPDGARLAEITNLHSITIANDCTPCCPCSYYVDVYLGLTRVWNRWAALAQSLEATRDTYAAGVDRWNTQYTCKLNSPARLVAATNQACQVFIGGNYCNFSQCCQSQLEIRFTFQPHYKGIPTSPLVSLAVASATLNASTTEGETAYAPQINNNTVRFMSDYANPQAMTQAKAQVCVPCTGDVDSVEVTMTVHFPDLPAGSACPTPPPVAVPAKLAAAWQQGGAGLGDPVRALVVKFAALDPTPPSLAACISCP